MPIASLGKRAEQLDHPPGAGPDIDQRVEGAVTDRALDRTLHFGFGHVQRADGVPDIGVSGEIALCGFRPVPPDRIEPRQVLGKDCAAFVVGPGGNEVEQRLRTPDGREHQKNPASFLAPLDNPGIGKDPDMPRHSRLALLEQLRQLADGQLHARQQGDDPQSRRVRHGLEQIGERKRIHQSVLAYKGFFIWSNAIEPLMTPRRPRGAQGAVQAIA